VGLKAFLIPNGFLDGGITGIAILLNQLYGINISFLLITISLPFLLMAWYTLSKRITIKSIISILILAIMVHLENFTSVTEDKLLTSIFGGLFLGAGIGITIKNGAVLDGSEVLGIFLNKQFGLSIGKVILGFNLILFGVTAITISLETAMYSTLTFLVTSKIIDLTIEGFEDYVGLMIVSEKSGLIEHELIAKIKTGTTLYRGSKGFGKRGVRDENDIIHTVINRIDIRRTYNLIDTIDKNAFIIEFDVNNVKGGILKKYLDKESIKTILPSWNKD
ncbi:MAG: YitT family protein, partial [Maribacter sp.]